MLNSKYIWNQTKGRNSRNQNFIYILFMSVILSNFMSLISIKYSISISCTVHFFCVALKAKWAYFWALHRTDISPQAWWVSSTDSFSVQSWAPRHNARGGLCLLITVSSAARWHLKALPGKIAVPPCPPFCNIKLCIPARLHLSPAHSLPKWQCFWPGNGSHFLSTQR